RVIELTRSALGPDAHSSYLGLAYLVRGQALLASGRSADAVLALRSAVEQLRPTLGSTHPETRLAERLAGGAGATKGSSVRCQGVSGFPSRFRFRRQRNGKGAPHEAPALVVLSARVLVVVVGSIAFGSRVAEMTSQNDSVAVAAAPPSFPAAAPRNAQQPYDY